MGSSFPFQIKMKWIYLLSDFMPALAFFMSLLMGSSFSFQIKMKWIYLLSDFMPALAFLCLSVDGYFFPFLDKNEMDLFHINLKPK